MRNYIKHILSCAAIILAFTSCQDPLDKTRLDIISSDVVWNDAALIEAYFADLYDQSRLITTPDGFNTSTRSIFAATTVGDEGIIRNRNGAYNLVTGILSSTDTNAREMGYWSNGTWQYLRQINTAIRELDNIDSALDEDFREARLGQVYFLRALFYFEKVKRYGGVPLVKEAQDANLSFEELAIPRSSEKETYDFIEEDLNIAIDLLSGKDVDLSRINVDAAHALRSRSMLYAGSIAENNSLLALADADGIIGINPSEAADYYAKSLESSRALLPAPLGTGSFALRDGDTVEKYRNIFNDIGSGDDTESLMIMQFTGVTGRANGNDENLLPRTSPSTHRGWGNVMVGHYETTEWFEYKDGTAGDELPAGYPNNGSTKLRDNIDASIFHDIEELFGDKDPRFRASMAVARLQLGSLGTAYLHREVVSNDAALAAGLPTAGAGQNVSQPSTLSTYKLANDADPQVDRTEGTHPLTVYRLAEIYLNFAEAALTTGNAGDALIALNAIRERAGLLPKGSITMDDVIQERRVELIFEYHRYWDLKRWRIAKDPLSREYIGLHYIWDTENDTYALFTDRGDNRDRFFDDRHYYYPIPIVDVEANGWKQTPGYE